MVQKEDFGDYVCIISKPGNTIERMVTISKKVNGGNRMNPNPVPMGKLILTMSVILFVGLSVIILYVRYGLKIQVHIKDSFNSLEENDGKDSDILIVHSPKDSEIVSALLATLENNYNYKCTSQELSAAARYSELQDEAQNPKLICVALKDLPKAQNEIKNSQGETLTSLSCLIGLILWDRKNDSRFWYSLRLRLPPKRRTEALENINLTQGENNSRLTNNSEESLNSLV
ncbi:hypothetical protein NQ317_016027 [Molorchus minor]|uniref:Uncharacterized protein n=1 Tax=Molorchus minor TaxID=1323400 RepID=A0ABQ9J8N0_9CUCU|nr:hypothetical protein NQ317_016027 [Molorchus minor]